MRAPIALAALSLGLALLNVGCLTHREDLARGRRAHEQGADERALAMFRAMEPRVALLSPAERVQYAFLRGTTDYRLGYRLDARHWLALAQAMTSDAATGTPGALSPEQRAQMDAALTELDAVVFDKGYDGLTNVLRAPSERSSAADPGGSGATKTKTKTKTAPADPAEQEP